MKRSDFMSNTQIEYLYRDADNYKVFNTCIVAGTITDEQKAVILDSLLEGEYFIPKLVGMPEKKFDTYDAQADHLYFELGAASFSPTDAAPTLELTAAELTERFRSHKGNWSAIDLDNALSMVNVLIDNMINDEGGHTRNVIERLMELGFTKDDLLCLQFPKSDIDDVFDQPEEEN